MDEQVEQRFEERFMVFNNCVLGKGHDPEQHKEEPFAPVRNKLGRPPETAGHYAHASGLPRTQSAGC